MKKNKMHIIDKIFLIGIAIIGVLGGLTDIFYWKDVESGSFPVFSCISIFASYTLWVVLLIYSFIRYKEKQEKPQMVKWFMYFILPFLHVAFIIVGLIIGSLLINLFNL